MVKPSISNRASILIVSIWVLVFFTFLAAGFYSIFSGQIRKVRFVRDRIAAENTAYSACCWSQACLRNKPVIYETLAGCSRRVVKDVGLSRFTYTLVDEARKLNINTAAFSAICGLAEMDGALAQKIASSDSRPFSVKEELFRLEDMTQAQYDAWGGLVTVYGDGAVNINTASEPVLRALGMPESVLSKILTFRSGSDDVAGTADDGVFTDAGTILNTLDTSIALTAVEKRDFSLLLNQGFFTVGSDVYTMFLTVQYVNKDIMTYRIVLDKKNIKEWKEQ